MSFGSIALKLIKNFYTEIVIKKIVIRKNFLTFRFS